MTRGRILIGALVLTMGLATIGDAAFANGGIGGRPANPNPDNPRTQSIFIFEIDKNGTKTDAITVINNSDEKQTIELLSTDSTITNTGAYTCKQNTEKKTGLGGWIRLSKNEVTLEAGSRENVEFTVSVPGDADVGEHNACLVFQIKDAEPEEQSGGVRVRTRQALRVVNTVPGELRRDITVNSLSVESLGVKQRFNLSVRNSGNVSADVDMSVIVKDMFGKEVVRSSGGYPVLADQEYSQAFVTDLRPMFGGLYKIQGAISYDSVIASPGMKSDQPPIQKTTDEQTVFLWPTVLGWVVIAAALALVGGAVFAAYRKVRRKRIVGAEWADYVVKEGDMLESIAKRRGTQWKDIARANNLKPPYSLSVGSSLRVPKNK